MESVPTKIPGRATFSFATPTYLEVSISILKPETLIS